MQIGFDTSPNDWLETDSSGMCGPTFFQFPNIKKEGKKT